MSPDFIRNHVVFTVAHGFVSVDGDVARDRLDDAGQRLSDIGIAVPLNRCGVHLIKEAVSLLLYDDFALRSALFNPRWKPQAAVRRRYHLSSKGHWPLAKSE